MEGAGPGAIIGTGIVVVLLAAAYFVPSILAFSRLHPRRWVILAINALLGITGIGWAIAFLWAIVPAEGDPPA